nr:unnamed protein product [Digitaria exilis]
MPRKTEDAVSTKSVELVKEEDCLEFDDPDEVDEEEEVEYEEIEEEVEYEEVEDEEEEEEEEKSEVACEVDAKHDSKLVDADQKDEEEQEKHAELLALPPHGSEVYVGGISSDMSSEDIKQLFESVGEVVEGKKIRVSSSQAKNRLFIGNIPQDWTQDDLKNAVEQVGPGVLKVNLPKASHSDRHKGYGFIEYYNQACAEYARQKMSTPEFKLDTNSPTVNWADPKNSGESASTAQVKSLYVKNLPKTVTEEQLKKLFEHLGEITKVVLPPAKAGHENRYGFVHFKERYMAMKALKNTERYELDGQLLDCSLAKADKKAETLSALASKGGPLLPSYTPIGYELAGGANPLGKGLAGAYNPLGNGLAGAFNPLGNGLAGAYGVLPARAAQPILYAPGAPSDHSLQGSSLCFRRLCHSNSKVLVVMVAVAAAVVDSAQVGSDREVMNVVVIATTAARADTVHTDVWRRCC